MDRNQRPGTCSPGPGTWVLGPRIWKPEPRTQDQGPGHICIYIYIALLGHTSCKKILSNFSKFTDWFTYIFLFNNSNSKWFNLHKCSQINSFAKKFPLMRKVKYQFKVPCKFCSDTADLRTWTQTLCVNRAPTQDIC